MPQNSFTFADLFRPDRFSSLVVALVLLGVSFIFEHFANTYALAYSLRPTSTYVGDLILDNLPAVDLNLIIVEGALLSILVVSAVVVFMRPQYLVFTLKAIAIFVAIRALFISLTHVGIYPGHIDPGLGFFDQIYSYLNFQTGFFFSGHTALPFLVALIFWEEKPVRTALMALSFVFGVAVLLGHIHYSIDVLAAPFMAYGIFKIAQALFPRDYALTQSGVYSIPLAE